MTSEDLQKRVRTNIARLLPYSTARDEAQGRIGVFLDANESPYENGRNRYPDPRQKALKARIGAIKGVAPEHIFIGNGSDEAIDLVLRIFCHPGQDNIVAIAPSYGMYRVAADINDVAVREVQLREDFSLDAGAVLAAADADTKAVFLCSPNNPSGNLLEKAQVERTLREFPGVVVVDEAYIDFSGRPGWLPRLDEFPNLIVLQTLSKAWGMAGLRLGLAFAAPWIAALFSRVKYPYNISKPVQETVLKALESPVDAQVAEIVRERARLEKALPAFACVRKIYPSDANFLLVRFDDADALYDFLLEKGIITRKRGGMKGCENCLRLTVGTPEENTLLLASLNDYEKTRTLH